MADAADLKSSVHPLTSFYQMILGSIYRRFSRQSKLMSCLVSQCESLIFPSSAFSMVCLSNLQDALIALKLNKRGKDKMSRSSGHVSEITAVTNHIK